MKPSFLILILLLTLIGTTPAFAQKSVFIVTGGTFDEVTDKYATSDFSGSSNLIKAIAIQKSATAYELEESVASVPEQVNWEKYKNNKTSSNLESWNTSYTTLQDKAARFVKKIKTTIPSQKSIDLVLNGHGSSGGTCYASGAAITAEDVLEVAKLAIQNKVYLHLTTSACYGGDLLKKLANLHSPYVCGWAANVPGMPSYFSPKSYKNFKFLGNTYNANSHSIEVRMYQKLASGSTYQEAYSQIGDYLDGMENDSLSTFEINLNQVYTSNKFTDQDYKNGLIYIDQGIKILKDRLDPTKKCSATSNYMQTTPQNNLYSNLYQSPNLKKTDELIKEKLAFFESCKVKFSAKIKSTSFDIPDSECVTSSIQVVATMATGSSFFSAAHQLDLKNYQQCASQKL